MHRGPADFIRRFFARESPLRPPRQIMINSKFGNELDIKSIPSVQQSSAGAAYQLIPARHR